MQSLYLLNRKLLMENTGKKYYKTETNNYVRLYIHRPKINYKRSLVFAFVVAIATLLLSIVASFVLRQVTDADPIIIFTITIILFYAMTAGIFLRRLLIWLITLYQAKAKLETRLKCCYEPSCSEYAILAIKKYGAVKGSIKAIKRLKRCHPPGGIDYP